MFHPNHQETEAAFPASRTCAPTLSGPCTCVLISWSMEHWKHVSWFLALDLPSVHLPPCKCLSIATVHSNCHTLSGIWACHLDPPCPARPHWYLIVLNKWFQEANDATEYLKSGGKRTGAVQAHLGDTEEGEWGEDSEGAWGWVPMEPETGKSSRGFSYSNHLVWPFASSRNTKQKDPKTR